jgi:hypothetical protein
MAQAAAADAVATASADVAAADAVATGRRLLADLQLAVALERLNVPLALVSELERVFFVSAVPALNSTLADYQPGWVIRLNDGGSAVRVVRVVDGTSPDPEDVAACFSRVCAASRRLTSAQFDGIMQRLHRRTRMYLRRAFPDMPFHHLDGSICELGGQSGYSNPLEDGGSVCWFCLVMSLCHTTPCRLLFYLSYHDPYRVLRVIHFLVCCFCLSHVCKINLRLLFSS